MRRRDFISLLGTTAVWPQDIHAEQAKKIPRIGVLLPGTPVTFSVRRKAFLDGLQQHGIEGTLKHWPGIGSAPANPDFGLPTITHTQAQLNAIDFATFRALLLQKLDERSPITKGEVFYYLGEISHRQGDDKKAIQMLERALDNDKQLAPALALMGKIKGQPQPTG